MTPGRWVSTASASAQAYWLIRVLRSVHYTNGGVPRTEGESSDRPGDRYVQALPSEAARQRHRGAVVTVENEYLGPTLIMSDPFHARQRTGRVGSHARS